MRRQEAEGAGEGAGRLALDGDAFRVDGSAPPPELEPLNLAAGVPAPAPLFGATLGALPAAHGFAARSVFVPLMGAPAARAGRATLAPRAAAPAPDHGDADAREAAWQLVREVAESLHVAPQRQARHGAVHLALKGRLLAGTEVTVVRHGQRLDVQIAAGTADGLRVLGEQIQALQDALADGADGCHVLVSLTGKPGI